MNDQEKIIYVVTEGDYEDYHICGIYDSLDLAEKAKLFYTNLIWSRIPAEIEIWIVNKTAENPGAENG